MNVFESPVAIKNGLGTPGNPGAYYCFQQAGNSPRVYSGTGNPNGILLAPAGSLWLDVNGTVYRNADSGTLWVAIGSGTAPTSAVGSIGVVLRPGDPAADNEHVFTDWATLYDTVIAPGGVVVDYPIAIIFDSSIVSPIVIGPTGNYELPYGTCLYGISFSGTDSVVIPDGVTFLSADGRFPLGSIDYNVTIESQNTLQSPFAPTVANQQCVIFRGGRLRAGPGAKPVISFDTADPSNDLIAVAYGGTIENGGSSAVAFATNNVNNTLSCISGALGVFDADSISGPATATIVEVPVSTAGFFSPQATFLGTVITFYFTSAGRLGYAPGNVADWSGTDPQNVATALDRIAAVLTPIP